MSSHKLMLFDKVAMWSKDSDQFKFQYSVSRILVPRLILSFNTCRSLFSNSSAQRQSTTLSQISFSHSEQEYLLLQRRCLQKPVVCPLKPTKMCLCKLDKNLGFLD
ncbi:hypothetical protein TNCV_2544801 [Trichonephila clavipes]|nr:hypothetical protein TNCV_2544801 [Trichonephila clavipes]